MKQLFVYCTDFIINVANLLEISYYEVNAFFFCFLMPFLVVVLLMIFIFQKIKLRRLRKDALNGVFIVMSLGVFTSCSNSATTGQSSPPVDTGINQPFFRSPIYTSSDQGKTWTPFDTGLPNDLDVNLIKSIGKELIITTESSGIFISKKNKTQWKSIGEDLPISKVTALQVVDNQIVISLFENGIYKSDDLGRTWQSLNYNLDDKKVMTVLPLKNEIFIGADYGIYQLKNKKWTPIFEESQVGNLIEVEGKIFAGTVKGVLRSDDFGENWKLIHERATAHNITFSDNKLVVMYVHGGVFISSDLGDTWSEAVYNASRDSYVYEVATVDSIMLISNTHGVHQSKDGGFIWKTIYYKVNLCGSIKNIPIYFFTSNFSPILIKN